MGVMTIGFSIPQSYSPSLLMMEPIKATRRLTRDLGRPSARAAVEKPRWTTTAAKNWKSLKSRIDAFVLPLPGRGLANWTHGQAAGERGSRLPRPDHDRIESLSHLQSPKVVENKGRRSSEPA